MIVLKVIRAIVLGEERPAIRGTPRVAAENYGVVLLAGALPFAATTWWSVITPLIAVLAILIGAGVIRDAGPPARVRQPEPEPAHL